MQRPSNCPVTTPYGYVAGYPLNGGYHMGVDFAYIPDNVIYAPEDGNYRLYPNNGSLGNAIHMWVGNKHHAFGHTSKYLITDNQFCKRGTPIAIMGATGAAQGVHLHWALAINGALVDPLKQVNESFIGKGDNNMFQTDQEIVEAYLMLRGVKPSASEIASWRGRPKQQFFQVGKAEADSVRKQLADVKKALANEQAKPPKEIVKEVTKIVEKPVEIIKEVPVQADEKAVVEGWFKKLWERLFK